MRSPHPRPTSRSSPRPTAYTMLTLGLGACASAAEGAADVPPDALDAADVAGEIVATDTTSVAPDAAAEVDAAPPAVVPAEQYCERMAEALCGFYVRCGRMAVADLEACRPVFDETCNARYEPLWAALAARGAVSLSGPGLAACADHLAAVACDQQIFDLDGGCQAVWRGLVPEGGACGPGLESFVCAEGTTCVLGLDFCGTCRPLAGDGPCDLDHRCPPDAVCQDGTCAARARVGEACADDGPPCVLGAACVAGVCAADAIVAVGDACDLDHRCPYKAACVGGVCRETVLVGASCDATTGCASGFCAGGTCVALAAEGDACTSGAACVSGRCGASGCEAPAFGCLAP